MLDDATPDEASILLEVDGEATTALLEPAPGGDRPLALVADDDRTIRVFLTRVLNNCGVEVVEATNGKEALDLFKQYQGAIHLVVLDVIMPVLGGEQVLEEIRGLDETIRVLVVSGEVDPEQRAQLLEAGATAFLSKPLDTISLTETIREVMPRSRDTRA